MQVDCFGKAKMESCWKIFSWKLYLTFYYKMKLFFYLLKFLIIIMHDFLFRKITSESQNQRDCYDNICSKIAIESLWWLICM